MAGTPTHTQPRRPSARSLHTLQAPQRIATMPSTSNELVTTILVANLHCRSCVQTINDVLSTLSPPPKAVDISIVTQTVTVRHSSKTKVQDIYTAIDEAGFEIASTPDADLADASSAGLTSPFRPHKHAKHVEQCTQCQSEEKAGSASHGRHRITLSVGGMTCASCSNTITDSLRELPGISDVAVDLLGNSAAITVDDPAYTDLVLKTIDSLGYEAEIVSTQPLSPLSVTGGQTHPYVEFDGPYHLTLSVGGMTCASCTNTITSLAQDVPGVSEVAVSLIGKSATATIARRNLAEQLAQLIEDAGYEAEIIGLEAVRSTEPVPSVRSVALRVDGMFCSHCPERVMSLLEPVAGSITVQKPITDYKDPILKLSYLPAPPDFTIRTILDCFDASGTFTVSVYEPPTLEERARRMYIREQRALLWRLLFSVVVAVPTLIIAVVYMSLVSHNNSGRMWWMRPIWAGNVSRGEWALFFLATPVMFYSCGMFHRRSIKELWALWRPGSRASILKRFIRFGSMNLLVSLGVSVAYFSSIALLALAALEAPSETGEGDDTTYFDSVVFLTMFLLAGRYLEAYSKGHTASAVMALGKLRPSSALLVTRSDATGDVSPKNTLSSSSDDVEKQPIESLNSVRKVPSQLLEIGDIVRVAHGASPPADGQLVSISAEYASFDESSLSGESKPVKKYIGDEVFVGTINLGSAVDIKIAAVGGETMLDHIVKVIREGQTRRAPIERVADLITGYFVPVVTLLAILTWVVWLSLGFSGALPNDYLDIPVGGWTVWSLEFAIAVFVVACPCGIGLAAPTALLVGSGLAAKCGILVRGGGEAFQEAAQLDLVVFDKTGTLTQGGDPQVIDADFLPSEDTKWTKEEILGIAAELESASTHPLAIALQAYCDENGAVSQSSSGAEETAGRGLKAEFKTMGCVGIIGNERWMLEHGAILDQSIENRLNAWKTEGMSVVLLALSKLAEPDTSVGDTEEPRSQHPFEIRAIFAIADQIRVEAPAVIRALQARGIGTWMISGDNEVTAKAVARKVGIAETNVIAEVLPHEKAQKVQWLQQVGMKRIERNWRPWSRKYLNARCIVAMVGDGINDAPALSAADVGIAIGSGSDVAISSASFILVSSHLKGLLTLTDLSRKVFNRVKFNFLWATAYNLIALPIAAGVIYPAHNHPRLAPVWASLAMALSSVSVVCSSLLLKLYKEPVTI